MLVATGIGFAFTVTDVVATAVHVPTEVLKLEVLVSVRLWQKEIGGLVLGEDLTKSVQIDRNKVANSYS